jgi:CheY-like chemotaxis protein
MAITNELIQLMGGRIEVTSEKGVGSTFTIFLNLEIQKNEEELKVNDTIQNIELRNVKILLVEDNELNRLVATNSLNYYHALVTEAINGKEAVEILKSQRFDLILMDLQMPEMDGLEATRIIRNELKITTPMIALTANALKNEIEKCMEVGMNDYVTKPFEEKHFLQVVTKNCNLKMITKKSQPMDIEIKDIKKQYDLVKIIELSHGNDSFVQKMSDLFCTNMKESVNELKHGFQANDYPKIKSVAHRMKPMIDNMCIHSLTQDIRDLESINIDTLDTLSIASQLDKLEKIIMEVITDLSSKKN